MVTIDCMMIIVPLHGQYVVFSEFWTVVRVDKAPRLSIIIVIWILSSDTICQLNQFNTNSEAAMLATQDGNDRNLFAV